MTRTYVITGSASGIGAATRAILESEGHRVIGVDIQEADVVADLATDEGRSALARRVGDVSDGRIDAVIAAAGIGGGEGEPERIIRVNYFGARATLESLRPLLAAGSDPRAAVVASVASLRAAPDDPVVEACLAGDEEQAVALVRNDESGRRAYAASKRALVRYCRRVSVTDGWAKAGIAINAVAPGVIETPMATYLIATPAALERTRREFPMPLHGVGRPEHVGSLLAWLTSASNGLVTGQLIFVDGGYDALTRGEDACYTGASA
jgi:NAD(P)-dependent dehydrogenase (short-subunit alcohol dehydrogenase family)